MSSEEEFGTLDLLYSKESLLPTSIAIGLTLLLLMSTTLDFMSELEDTAVFNAETPEWTILFDTQVIDLTGDGHTYSHTEIWGDGEEKIVDFDITDLLPDDDTRIAYIAVSLIPEENTGVSPSEPDVGCDSIGVTVVSDNSTLVAQWDDDRNILQGNDADCEDIPLFLQAYPQFYNDTSTTILAKNEFQALIPWTEDGWGLGELSIKVKVDVQSYAGQGVGIIDDDEEITIQIDVYSFTSSLQE